MINEFLEKLVVKEEGVQLRIPTLQTSYLTFCRIMDYDPVPFHELQKVLEGKYEIGEPQYNILSFDGELYYNDITLNLPNQDISKFKEKYYNE